MSTDWLHFGGAALVVVGALLLAAGRGEAQGDNPGWFIVADREAFLRLLDLDRPELAGGQLPPRGPFKKQSVGFIRHARQSFRVVY